MILNTKIFWKKEEDGKVISMLLFLKLQVSSNKWFKTLTVWVRNVIKIQRHSNCYWRWKWYLSLWSEVKLSKKSCRLKVNLKAMQTLSINIRCVMSIKNRISDLEAKFNRPDKVVYLMTKMHSYNKFNTKIKFIRPKI